MSKRSLSTPAISSTESLDASLKKSKTVPLSRNASVQGIVERDSLPSREETGEDATLRIISWNVNGLRALVKNKLSEMRGFVHSQSPHLLCLQETKLQEEHEDSFKDLFAGYTPYFSSSVAKKGYSGTAIFVRNDIDQSAVLDVPSEPPKRQSSLDSFFGKKAEEEESNKKEEEDDEDEDDDGSPSKKKRKTSLSRSKSIIAFEADSGAPPFQPSALAASSPLLSLSFGINAREHDQEGRIITAEFPSFFLVNAYVPNAGMDLKRLAYRTQEWDPALFAHLKSLEARKPTILTGDLNVAHLDLDIYNYEAPHVTTVPGCTDEERHSCSTLLLHPETGFRDAFRRLNPEAQGQFTYWSMRTRARGPNKGLRLDYFMVSPSLLPGSEGTRPPAFLEEEGKEAVEEEEDASAGKKKKGGKKKKKSRKGMPPRKYENEFEEYPAFDQLPTPSVSDCYILYEETEGMSDHCPVIAKLKL